MNSCLFILLIALIFFLKFFHKQSIENFQKINKNKLYLECSNKNIKPYLKHGIPNPSAVCSNDSENSVGKGIINKFALTQIKDIDVKHSDPGFNPPQPKKKKKIKKKDDEKGNSVDPSWTEPGGMYDDMIAPSKVKTNLDNLWGPNSLSTAKAIKDAYDRTYEEEMAKKMKKMADKNKKKEPGIAGIVKDSLGNVYDSVKEKAMAAAMKVYDKAMDAGSGAGKMIGDAVRGKEVKGFSMKRCMVGKLKEYGELTEDDKKAVIPIVTKECNNEAKRQRLAEIMSGGPKNVEKNKQELSKMGFSKNELETALFWGKKPVRKDYIKKGTEYWIETGKRNMPVARRESFLKKMGYREREINCIKGKCDYLSQLKLNPPPSEE